MKKYYSGANLGKEIDMWKVQTESYYDKKGYWIGLIMVGMGFNDSPDCEFISGGKSTKDITGMALGRQANIFHWGFSASPDFMTESAKKVFINTVFYMAKYKGSKPIVKRYRSPSRLEVNEACYRNTKTLINTKTFKYKLTGNKEKDEKIKYYNENYGFFYMEGLSTHPVIDFEAMSMGIPNNDKRILDKAISMLEKNNDANIAMTILKRYTFKNFSTAKQWRGWYNKVKDRLFFTELGGYKFMENSLK